MTTNRATQIGLTILPIILSLLITAILILAIGSDPRQVFERVWEGAFRDPRSFSQVINFWIPLTLVSIGLIVTFTTGLWNIGVEGQMMMGGIFATGAALLFDLPQIILIPIELSAAMLGGALWAALVGLLKTRLRVHEIFGGVALNALANIFSIYLISGPWKAPEGGTELRIPLQAEALLPPLSPDLDVNPLMFIIVLVFTAMIIFALRRTLWGLRLKAVGKNAASALLLGVPTQGVAMSAFMVCGAAAGTAGAYRVLFTFDSLRPQISGGIGFLGLLVVLLVSMRALWVPLVTFTFAAILGGSTRLRITMQLDASLAGVLQGILVLTMLLMNGLRQRLSERTRSISKSEPIVQTYEETVEIKANE